MAPTVGAVAPAVSTVVGEGNAQYKDKGDQVGLKKILQRFKGFGIIIGIFDRNFIRYRCESSTILTIRTNCNIIHIHRQQLFFPMITQYTTLLNLSLPSVLHTSFMLLLLPALGLFLWQSLRRRITVLYSE
jgi:hypothetical protein